MRSYWIAQGILLSVLWRPGWLGVWGRMDTCIYTTESLCCPPETITTLLIGYTQNKIKSFKKKGRRERNDWCEVPGTQQAQSKE